MTDSSDHYINPSSRQLPRRRSPLASHWVAAGCVFDERTGLVSPITPTPPSGGSSSTTTTDTCIDGVGEYEVICPDGVRTLDRPAQPER
jgi:hypothetical protein